MKKSAPAIAPQCARRNVRHDARCSGTGGMPCAFRIRAIVERWGIEFPAIPELDIDGVKVDVTDPEDIIPVF